VILIGLVTVAINATVLLAISHFRFLSIEFRIFPAKESLVAAIFIGARLAQKWSSAKPQPA
jgi:hypothetical protein